jgi:ligand-binding sensor domain-containing protein
METPVSAMVKDPAGRLWLSGNEKGVYRLEHQTFTSVKSLGGPHSVANAALTDSAGRVWFGFDSGDVVSLDGDKIHTFSRKDGLSIGHITSIAGRGSSIWVGGESGLEYFDGKRFHPVLTANGQALDGVSGVIATGNDGIWLAENRGVLQIPEHEVQALQQDYGHRVSFEVFDFLDGLRSQLLIA